MVLIPKYILILFFLILVDYTAGIVIERSQGRKRKNLLLASLAVNVGTLAVFKYYNFFIENLNTLGTHFDSLSIILPIGLSFHTFQSMSYTIEVYRGTVKAEKNFWIYSLYVMFYPQLVAGPIERPQNLLPQLHKEHSFEWSRVKSGLQLMMGGFFKKVFVADVLAILVDHVYNQPGQFTGMPLILATYAFAIQIYCDFSGYTDIARGSARVMGFELMVNFNEPYLAVSVSDFWKRWHISLSTWFRDYVYIPMGGNRVSRARWYFNLLFVFLLSGFWHGAKWTFVLWGFVHGIYQVFSNLLVSKRIGFPIKGALVRGIKIFFVFNLVSFAWIFFRANTLMDAKHIITHLFRFSADFNLLSFLREVRMTGIAIPVIAILFWLSRNIFKQLTADFQDAFHHSRTVRICSYLTVAVVAFQIFFVFMIGLQDQLQGSAKQFIYFQF